LRNNPASFTPSRFIFGNFAIIPTTLQLATNPIQPTLKLAIAWDVTRGDTSVVIAIVDTGVD
jgi:hypothetical protein